ncbi:MAG TPA: hypothetical protein VGQ09_09705 [Chitinophagaceae bacterium]|jgi:hypothetical protein|nr:hypothetical protein [Chitinophagaceae bacterium]
MKKFFLLYKILFLSLTGVAQLAISPGTQWVNSGNITVNVQNMDFVNNGTFATGSGSVKFTGNQSSSIWGASSTAFNILEVVKTNNSKILLGRNINIGSSINFISGMLDLNNNNILLNSAANLAGESETAQVIGTGGGYVEIAQNLDAPFSANPGNLGATITALLILEMLSSEEVTLHRRVQE